MLDGSDRVELLVCTKCRGLGDPAEGDERPGHVLHRRLAEAGVEGVEITAVECLSNCTRGCTIALRGPGRWTYVYGALDSAADLAPIREGAARYRDTPDGLIPWRERPEHFRKNCIARIPPI
jgi:predicted metal-binding protein